MTPEELELPSEGVFEQHGYPVQGDQVLFAVFAGGLTFGVVKDVLDYSTLLATVAGVGVGWLVWGGHSTMLQSAYHELTKEYAAYNEASESPDAKDAAYDAFTGYGEY